MITYGTVGSNKLETTLEFYDTLLPVAGMAPMFDHPEGGRFYAKGGKVAFAVLTPRNGEAATVGNGTMLAFELDSREQVEQFHAKALALGGSCEGAPGLRGPEEMGMFFAYLRDPEGNKLAAFKLG
jgi:catechol 2,3-dioxygenase-like lactoylglutathione lyase family enzyme